MLTLPVSWTCPWCGAQCHGDYYQDPRPQCDKCKIVLFWIDVFGRGERAELNAKVLELNEALLFQLKEATNV